MVNYQIYSEKYYFVVQIVILLNFINTDKTTKQQLGFYF